MSLKSCDKRSTRKSALASSPVWQSAQCFFRKDVDGAIQVSSAPARSATNRQPVTRSIQNGPEQRSGVSLDTTGLPTLFRGKKTWLPAGGINLQSMARISAGGLAYAHGIGG